MQVLVMRFMVRAVMRWRKPPATLRTLHHYGRGLASQPTRNGLREGKLRALWRSSVILAALLDESYVLTLSRLRDLDSPSLGAHPSKRKNRGDESFLNFLVIFSIFGDSIRAFLDPFRGRIIRFSTLEEEVYCTG